jgi:cell division initiation protein
MREALSPEELENAGFSTSLRGYDKDEVDAYLQSVAAELRESQKQRSEKLYETLGEEMGSLLQHARDSAVEMTRRAEADAAQVRDEASADAARTREEAAADGRAIREEATYQATEIRAAAERDASQRISEAERRVAELEDTETQARERIKAVRAELESLSQRLRPLEQRAADPSTPEPTNAEQPLAGAGQEGHEPDQEPSVGTQQEPAARDDAIQLPATESTVRR